MTNAGLHSLALEQLRESPLNPRKHFDAAALAELTDSIRTSGIIIPLLVRPGAHPESYEIAAGHRRFRAAAAAGLTTVPCLVREMDDPTFIEILNVDNLQRDDLHPLEEAAGFRTLMEQVGYDIPAIAKRVGHKPAYIYDRLRLLKLIEPAKALFLEGAFELAHAVILARLAPSDQERALNRDHTAMVRGTGLFEPDTAGDLFAEDRNRRNPDGTRGLKPVSPRELQAWVNDNVRFDPLRDETAAQLFPQTMELVRHATDERRRVVHITYEYRVADGARDANERTYGVNHWKRADGAEGSKCCDRAEVGLVVAGPSRGQAFLVCVDKAKCRTHWARERRRLAAHRPEASGRDDAEAARESRDDARRRAAQDKWNRLIERATRPGAHVALLNRIATHIDGLPVAHIVRTITRDAFIARWGVGRGAIAQAYPVTADATPERVLRAMLFDALASMLPTVPGGWMRNTIITEFKRHGLDFRKLLDEVAPAAAKPAKPAKSNGATSSAAGQIVVKKIRRTLRERKGAPPA